MRTENLHPEQLNTAKRKILTEFKRGRELTTFTGNQCGRTVDFRKVVSELRKEGWPIKDSWNKAPDGRRYKVYYLPETEWPIDEA